jgi:hypothetical protein
VVEHNTQKNNPRTSNAEFTFKVFVCLFVWLFGCGEIIDYPSLIL